MASKAKKTTMGKLAREAKMREKRAEKAARKQARKLAADADPVLPEIDDLQPVTETGTPTDEPHDG
jgi:hypothetical protein